MQIDDQTFYNSLHTHLLGSRWLEYQHLPLDPADVNVLQIMFYCGTEFLTISTNNCYFTGGIPKGLLEENIREWILEKTGTKVEVDLAEAVKLLTSFGIMSAYDFRLHVLPMDAAIRNLPQQPQSLVARSTESDISEGYDRDDFLETREQFEKRESKSSGWE